MHFTTSDEPRSLSGAWWAQEWDFLVDDHVVGQIAETVRGYRGKLTFPQHTVIPEQVYRSAVEDLMTRQYLVHLAAQGHVTLKLDDIAKVETGYPEIDGMDAGEWIDAMTME